MSFLTDKGKEQLKDFALFVIKELGIEKHLLLLFKMAVKSSLLPLITIILRRIRLSK